MAAPPRAFDPNRTAVKGESNYEPVDKWTASHVGIGMAFGFAGVPFWAVTVGAIAWEIAERPIRMRQILHSVSPDAYAGQDTAVNALWDVVGNMAGWWIGDQIRQRTRRQGRR